MTESSDISVLTYMSEVGREFFATFELLERYIIDDDL
jgi:hypothetical protein